MPQGIQGPFTVTKVVDGDTIHVDANGQRLKVRPIGMDTPEVVDPRKSVQCFGREASAQAKTLLGGQAVYLETDPARTPSTSTAARWPTSGSTGDLFNLDMIASGNAHEYTYGLPYRYQAAEDDARTHERGLWSPNSFAA